MTKLNTRYEDTIAQVSTALANNAISIIKISIYKYRKKNFNLEDNA